MHDRQPREPMGVRFKEASPLRQRNQDTNSTLRMSCTRPQASCSERFKPDDHSELVPLLPIPNRTVKRLSADDSADSRVKVGHRQATYPQQSPCTAGALSLDVSGQ